MPVRFSRWMVPQLFSAANVTICLESLWLMSRMILDSLSLMVRMALTFFCLPNWRRSSLYFLRRCLFCRPLPKNWVLPSAATTPTAGQRIPRSTPRIPSPTNSFSSVGTEICAIQWKPFFVIRKVPNLEPESNTNNSSGMTALMAVFFAFPSAMIGNRIAVESTEKLWLLYESIGLLKVHFPNCLCLLLAYRISSFLRAEGMPDSMFFEVTRGNFSSRIACWTNTFACRMYSSESLFSSLACVFVGFNLIWTVFI